PRDKADLLVALYEKASFAAKVEQAKLDPAKRSLSILFPRIARPAFQIEDADQASKRWADMTGVQPPAQPFNFVDSDGSQAKSLASKLATLVTPPATLDDPADLLDHYFPVVSVMVGGTEKFANPAVSDGVFGQSYAESNPFSATATTTTPATVKLWARKAFGPDRNDPIDLVQNTWTVQDLIGRRVNVQARPPLPFIQLMPAKLEELTTFIPMLSVEGGDLSAEQGSKLTQIGDAFTLRGDRLAWNADGTVTMNGLTLSDPANPNAVAQVDKLQVVSVNAKTFPSVRVQFAALDKSGAHVPGLTARDAHVKEEGTRLNGSLRPLSTARRVLFLFDGSGSVAPQFLGAQLKPLVASIASSVLAQPNTEMAVGAIDQPDKHPFVKTVAEVEAQYDNSPAVGSGVWRALQIGVQREPDVIILVSDFAATDTKTPAVANSLLQSNAVLLSLGAGADLPTEVVTMNDTVATMGGVAASVANHAAALTQVNSNMPALKANYEFSYRAPGTGPTLRKLDVALENATPTDQGSYTAAPSIAPPPALVGLYLTVKVGSREVTRTLAGIPPEAAVESGTALDADAVHAALFGATTLVFEGAAPTMGALADDILQARLAHEDAWDTRTDLKDFADAWQAGVPSLPAKALALSMPLSPANAAEVTFPTGARVTAFRRRPQFGATSEDNVDLMPFSPYRTVGQSPGAAWQTTFARTTVQAIDEAGMFSTSTVSLLGSAELEAVPAKDLDTHFKDAANASEWKRIADSYNFDVSSAYIALVPKSASPVAYYSVHMPTGTVRAVLPD
nr:VWA domain-containing protein [Polyangiaceae bacterium]